MEFSPFNYDLTLASPQMQPINVSNSLNNHFILSPELQIMKFLSHSLNSTQLNNKSHYHQPLLMHNHLLPIKEILEFPGRDLYEPNTLYRNILYIYPLAINLCGANSIRSSNTNSSFGNAPAHLSSTSSSSSLLSSSSARNIAVKVNFMKGEEEHCALPVIFSKASSTLEYCKEVFVNVVYHNKTPQYHDEVKIKLPALLNGANYHLLFTFYHISCQSSKDQNQLETVIGYSWLPIKQQFQFETTVHFTNGPSSSDSTTNSGMSAAPTTNLSAPQPNTSSVTNRCVMINSGIYSLPISFEKLPFGYSNLNYSIYDNSATMNATNANATVSFHLNEPTPIPNSSMGMNPIYSDFASLSPTSLSSIDSFNSKISDNITQVNTLLYNINSTNSSASTTFGAMPSSTVASQAAQSIAALGSTGPGHSKSFFDVKLKLVSTIHTQDVYLERFIAIANIYANNNQAGTQTNPSHVNSMFGTSKIACSNTTSYGSYIELLLKNSIMDICYADSQALVKFLFVILDKLFTLMMQLPSLASTCLEAINRIVYKVTHLLPSQNDFHQRNRILVQYIKYACNLPPNQSSPNDTQQQHANNQQSAFYNTLNKSGKLFHEELAALMLNAISNRYAREHSQLRDLMLRNSWFFFEILF